MGILMLRAKTTSKTELDAEVKRVEDEVWLHCFIWSWDGFYIDILGGWFILR